MPDLKDKADRLRAKLTRPPLSAKVTPAWNVFVRMPKPITYRELEAFCRLEGYPLEPWEVRAIMMLARRVGAGR